MLAGRSFLAPLMWAFTRPAATLALNKEIAWQKKLLKQ